MSSKPWGRVGVSTDILSSQVLLSDETGLRAHCVLEAAKEGGASKNSFPKNVLHIGICESLKLKNI